MSEKKKRKKKRYTDLQLELKNRLALAFNFQCTTNLEYIKTIREQVCRGKLNQVVHIDDRKKVCKKYPLNKKTQKMVADVVAALQFFMPIVYSLVFSCLDWCNQWQKKTKEKESCNKNFIFGQPPFLTIKFLNNFKVLIFAVFISSWPSDPSLSSLW